MTKEKLAWLAGFMDGEGCISIKRMKRNTGLKTTVHYQAWVTIGMSNKPENVLTLNAIKEYFGGHTYNIKPGRSNKFGATHWGIVSNKAVELLRKIYPYLMIKNAQAKIAMDFQSKCISSRGGKHNYLKDQDRRKKQEEYFYEMRKHNVKNKLRLQRLNDETPKGEAIV